VNKEIKKIGIFGGTFNPPHIAHSIIAMQVKDLLNLDKIIFIPSGNHPFKDSISPGFRLAMAEIAFSENEYFEVSDIEIRKTSGKTYTVDTLEDLKIMYKDSLTEFYLIIGSDNLIDLPKWKDPDRLFELSKIVVISRPGFMPVDDGIKYLDKVIIPPIPLLEISSTVIRKYVYENKPVKYLVHPGVEKFISEKNLYKQTK